MSESCWKRVEQQEGGVPMEPGEVIKLRKQNVSLTIPAMSFGNIGTLTITNKRFVFQVFNQSIAYQVYQPSITNFSPVRHSDKEGYAYMVISTSNEEKYSFQILQNDLNEINRCLVEIASATAVSSGGIVKKKVLGSSTGVSKVGVRLVQQNVAQNIEDTSRSLNAYLQDIGHLKEKAQELLTLARILKDKGDSESMKDLGDVCSALGLEDPVTKATSGKNYASDLAKHFTTAMVPYLEKNGGVLSVAEAYCRYNRILGTDYISPSDMADAIQVIKQGSFPILVDVIEGITVILLATKSYQSILTEISSMISDGSFVTPLSMAKRTQLPHSICKSYLLRMENAGTLARDDTIAGIRFYQNLFPTFTLLEY